MSRLSMCFLRKKRKPTKRDSDFGNLGRFIASLRKTGHPRSQDPSAHVKHIKQPPSATQPGQQAANAKR